MKRRHFLGLSVTSTAVFSSSFSHNGLSATGHCDSEPEFQNQNAPVFVLVHGTWGGAWIWQDVSTLLRGAGYRVYTPTLTGCGERVHLSTQDVGLETHIQDVVNVVEYEELDNIVLVGHSFSGLVITGVADRIKDKINRIVFLDALVPREGVLAAVNPNPETKRLLEAWLKSAEHFKDGHRMTFWDKYPIDMLINKEHAQHEARLRKLISTHPAKTWTDALQLRNGGWENLNPTYIHCIGQTYKKSSPWMFGPAKHTDWAFIEIDAPRMAMITHPQLVASTFLQLL